MHDHRSAFLAAGFGFVLTLAVQLPPILEERADIAETRAAFALDDSEEQVALDSGTTSRFAQLIASSRVR